MQCDYVMSYRTESKVCPYPLSVVHERFHRAEELVSVRARRPVRKVLARKFGNPNIHVKGVVEFDEVVNHVCGVGTIIVNSQSMDSTTSAFSEETLVPCYTRRAVGARG